MSIEQSNTVDGFVVLALRTHLFLSIVTTTKTLHSMVVATNVFKTGQKILYLQHLGKIKQERFK